MISHVPDRVSTPEELKALLERLRLQSAGPRTSPEVAQAQQDLLLARIAALTEAVRGSGRSDVATLASRLLLDDLALVIAQFRGEANGIHASLSGALDGLTAALAAGPSPDATDTRDTTAD
jgi:hypothetical protein